MHISHNNHFGNDIKVCLPFILRLIPTNSILRQIYKLFILC